MDKRQVKKEVLSWAKTILAAVLMVVIVNADRKSVV